MNKRAEKAALKAYPNDAFVDVVYAFMCRNFYQEGYEQAEKDTIERIREQVKQWMPEKDGKEYTYREKLAFNSVLHLLEEMEEEKAE